MLNVRGLLDLLGLLNDKSYSAPKVNFRKNKSNNE
jgi:hypothetical protein